MLTKSQLQSSVPKSTPAAALATKRKPVNVLSPRLNPPAHLIDAALQKRHSAPKKSANPKGKVGSPHVKRAVSVPPHKTRVCIPSKPSEPGGVSSTKSLNSRLKPSSFQPSIRKEASSTTQSARSPTHCDTLMVSATPPATAPTTAFKEESELDLHSK